MNAIFPLEIVVFSLILTMDSNNTAYNIYFFMDSDYRFFRLFMFCINPAKISANFNISRI